MKVLDPLSGYKLAAGDSLMHVAFLISVIQLPYTDCKEGSYEFLRYYLIIGHSFYVPNLLLDFEEPCKVVYKLIKARCCKKKDNPLAS